MSALAKSLSSLSIELDPFIIEHLELSLKDCETDDERRELCEPFLEEAGFTELDTFMDLLLSLDSDEEPIDSPELRRLPNSEPNSKPKSPKLLPTQKVYTPKQNPPKRRAGQHAREAALAQRQVNLSSLSLDDDSPSSPPKEHLDQPRKVSQKLAQKPRRKKTPKETEVQESTDVEDESKIQAWTKQSRFHVDTLQTLSNEVDLHDLTLTIGERELLTDCRLKLVAGVKYGMVGRNGVGKSTLLKAIGYGLVDGFPTNIKVVYVEQLDGVKPSEKIVDVVLKADVKAQCARDELDMLTRAMEHGGVSESVRNIEIARLENRVEAAAVIARKRSGERGALARKQLLELEHELTEMKESSALDLSEATQKALNMVQDLHHVLEVYDSDAAESKVKSILKGLGFSELAIEGEIGRLSGGWRIRVALAQALYMQPDILLLDEPTNHLEYLENLDDTTLVLISHDRNFINDIIDEVIVVRNQTLTYYTGNYDTYEKTLQDNLINAEKTKATLDKKRAHIEKSIEEGMRQAKQKGDDKKLGMVASRKKKLNDRFGIERSAKGHRFKLNGDLVGHFLTSRLEATVDRGDVGIKWKLPVPEPLRHYGSLVQVENMSFGYTSKPVLSSITLNIEIGARVGICGANGDGKSTLMELIVGNLSPGSGTIIKHPQARIGYFSQNHIDAITHASTETTLEYIKQTLQHEGPDQLIRGHFGGFGIGGDLMNQKVSSLSGGQLVRVAFGISCFSAPHFLILDEITNHLDYDSIEAVIEALGSFTGAVLCVSHDVYFMEKVATGCVYMLRDGGLVALEDMQQYVKLLRKEKRRK